MADKTKNQSHVKHIPKDAQVIVSIMKDMGIADYEPKVINQLLEFTYRYVTCILDDSKIYANHSKKKFIDVEDVRLAVKMQLEKSFTNPPPREVLLDVAKSKNSIPLPFVKPSYGLRLPPDRYCLNGTNYKLKSPVRKGGKIGGMNTSGGAGRMNSPGYSIAKRPGTITTISRTQTISMPKPVFKPAISNPTVVRAQPQMKPKLPATPDPLQVLPPPTIKMEIEETTDKRKREDDSEDYDVP